jgi:hypothetical protein
VLSGLGCGDNLYPVELDAGPAPDAGPDATIPSCLNRPEAVVPDKPTIIEPRSGRIDVTDETLVMLGSQYRDGNGDKQAASEFEIWRLAKNGDPVVRVWSADVSPVTTFGGVSLADGQFEIAGVLEEWQDYAVRVRYREVSAACQQYSEWSELLPFRTDDGSSFMFDESFVHEVRIDLSRTSWEAINAQARPPGCVPYERDYHPGTVTFNGTVLPGAGVRSKGGCGSSRWLGDYPTGANGGGKASFKINLEWDNPSVPGCPDKRRIHGLKRLTLNSMIQDDQNGQRTYLHDKLGYEYYKEMGVPTPRTAHIRVYLNGRFMGLYLNVESVDRRYLERRYESRYGALYEGTYWCDLIPENVPDELDPSPPPCLSRKFKVDECSPAPDEGDPLTYEPVREFIDVVDQFTHANYYPAITEYMMWDVFLSQWAAEAVMEHWDSYTFRIINNYRVYHDPGPDKWTIIPHGIDQAMEETIWAPINPFAPAGTLARKCACNLSCCEQFKSRLGEAIDTFDAMQLDDRAQEVFGVIADDVVEDPWFHSTKASYQNAVNAFKAWVQNRPAYMQGFLTTSCVAAVAQPMCGP